MKGHIFLCKIVSQKYFLAFHFETSSLCDAQGWSYFLVNTQKSDFVKVLAYNMNKNEASQVLQDFLMHEAVKTWNKMQKISANCVKSKWWQPFLIINANLFYSNFKIKCWLKWQSFIFVYKHQLELIYFLICLKLC